ncbi:hypothetical protein [Mameliella sediminis]|uniref:hypothetical protein n=1 Tax=Mameliella sediminis TaxID=2836866 RepID=UPI001C4579E4|nr:hypothetical protein [Mameliella sediminis]MBY6114394.1 hypothetical protein [Antarctobacter heliothermus]MBY6143967.1 hypothetical protein [Mameliella alba]MBV7393125.1 hypothetical protein [Mameliella sediminis]MBY6163403.1 hypothetical protein [Mameliella alba]MBY6171666.1 hypothetical protein [Mameliella alba]
MKTFIASVALLAGLAQGAQAQSTTEARVLGPSGVPVYTVQVLGQDGVTYNCRPETEQRDGQEIRYCRRVAGGGVVSGDPFPIGAGAVIAGVIALIAVSSASGTD